MIIRQVTPGLHDWARLAVGVEDACKNSPPSDKHSFHSIKSLIDNGVMLWFACEEGEENLADFCIQITKEDERRIFWLPVMFGREMERWQYLAREFFIDMAKANHCQTIRVMSFKPGIGKFYDRLEIFKDFRRVHVFEKEV